MQAAERGIHIADEPADGQCLAAVAGRDGIGARDRGRKQTGGVGNDDRKGLGDPGLPVSETLTPEIRSLFPTPVVAEVGTFSTGILFTVTAMFLTGAEPPRLSVALSVMLSEPAMPSRSANVASDALTSAKEPLMVSFVLPFAEMTVSAPDCAALSAPFTSVSTAVKVSPPKAPGSVILTPDTLAE